VPETVFPGSDVHGYGYQVLHGKTDVTACFAQINGLYIALAAVTEIHPVTPVITQIITLLACTLAERASYSAVPPHTVAA
jgi:hypothetical protein